MYKFLRVYEILLLGTIVSAVDFALYKNDMKTGRMTVYCQKQKQAGENRLFYDTDVYEDDTLLYDGWSTSKKGNFGVNTICGDRDYQLPAGQMVSNSFNVRPQERNTICLSAEAQCENYQKFTFVGRSSFFKCETPECEARNLLGDKYVSPFISLDGVPNNTLVEFKENVIMAPVDYSMMDRWNGIGTKNAMQHFMSQIYYGIKFYNKVKVVTFSSPGTLPTKGEKFLLVYRQTEDCEPPNGGFSKVGEPCDGPFTFYYVQRSPDYPTDFEITERHLCGRTVTFTLFFDIRAVDNRSKFYFLPHEFKNENFDFNKNISYNSTTKCGLTGVKKASIVKRELMNHFASFCPERQKDAGG
ncbi:hypothetical protein AbHV_ORF11 [Abalone herpesvirus Victoria/AUS/2009]|uniref:Uncharacterized protein n=1 Tax=Abalone herpesvirus (isolate Abalone/Australia/Victoria/2009) TaxID=1241371 RepID=K4JV15_ABHV|nr:hypothetical protein AbHV_ORF11 [Abalone herpesvirus Victoria/AUS/2009]AFU90021.1 hypothetical protein AbHV_ORF11 [Abalone herpesvirus Victoria/AUS/2009]